MYPHPLFAWSTAMGRLDSASAASTSSMDLPYILRVPTPCVSVHIACELMPACRVEHCPNAVGDAVRQIRRAPRFIFPGRGPAAAVLRLPMNCGGLLLLVAPAADAPALLLPMNCGGLL